LQPPTAGSHEEGGDQFAGSSSIPGCALTLVAFSRFEWRPWCRRWCSRRGVGTGVGLVVASGPSGGGAERGAVGRGGSSNGEPSCARLGDAVGGRADSADGDGRAVGWCTGCVVGRGVPDARVGAAEGENSAPVCCPSRDGAGDGSAVGDGPVGDPRVGDGPSSEGPGVGDSAGVEVADGEAAAVGIVVGLLPNATPASPAAVGGGVSAGGLTRGGAVG